MAIGNITDKIIGDAKEKAKTKLDAAEIKVQDIKRAADLQIEKIRQETERSLSDIEHRMREETDAEIRMKEKEALSIAGQEAVSEIIQTAKKRILNLSDSDYFALLEKLYRKTCEDKEGELLLCERDKLRMPKGFVKRLSKKLALSEENAPSEGFIVRYGKIFDNCTFDAIFEDKQNVFFDIAAKCIRGDNA